MLVISLSSSRLDIISSRRHLVARHAARARHATFSLGLVAIVHEYEEVVFLGLVLNLDAALHGNEHDLLA